MKIEVDPGALHALANRYRWAGKEVAGISADTAKRAVNTDLLAAEALTALWRRRIIEDDLLRAARRLAGSASALALLDATEIDAAAVAVLASQAVDAVWAMGDTAQDWATAVLDVAQQVPELGDQVFGAKTPVPRKFYEPGGTVTASTDAKLEVALAAGVGGKVQVQVIRETIKLDNGRTIFRVRLLGEAAALAAIGAGAKGLAGAHGTAEGGGTVETVWDLDKARSADQLLARLALNAGAAQAPLLGVGGKLALRALGKSWLDLPPPNSWSVGSKAALEGSVDAGSSNGKASVSLQSKLTHHDGTTELSTTLTATLDGTTSSSPPMGIPSPVGGSGALSISLTQPLEGRLPKISVQFETIGKIGLGPDGGVLHGGVKDLVKNTYSVDLDLGEIPDSQGARNLRKAIESGDVDRVQRSLAMLHKDGVIDWSHERFIGVQASAGIDVRVSAGPQAKLKLDGSVTQWVRVP